MREPLATRSESTRRGDTARSTALAVTPLGRCRQRAMSSAPSSAPAPGSTGSGLAPGAFEVYLDRRIIAILFLGFSSGLPLMLVLPR